MRLTFLGAAGTVTGSKYLLDDGQDRILIDCGLFQGLKELRLRNWEGLPIAPEQIRAVLLTHAHIDHSGYLPWLAAHGFIGPIYCSEATYELCKIMLPDSGRLQEDDAENANRHRYSKHRPALPLYTEQQARDCLKLFKPVALGLVHSLPDSDFEFSFHHAGHILGATFIRVANGGTSVLFSGDIGRMNDPVMREPAEIQNADYVVVESTYGDRLHPQTDPALEMERVINETVVRGGTVVIPAFAVGRAQSLLFYIHKLKKEKRIPEDLPVYLDSPMAINATEVLKKFPGDHRLSKALCDAVCSTATYVQTRDDSKKLDEPGQKSSIIISASGMATGGRILYHLKRFLGDERNTILLAGFQAAGTRGDRLARGEKELKIHGKDWPVRAQIAQLDSLSAHADYSEILQWLEYFNGQPRKIFITHGEASSAASLKDKIEQQLQWDVVIPAHMHCEAL